MRILLYGPSYLPATGGMEIHMRELAGALAKAGAEVAIATQQQGETDPKEPCPVHRWPMVRLPKGERLLQWRLARRLASLHRSFPFDVLHAHSIFPGAFLASRACRLLHIPLVATCHGDNLIPNHHGCLNWLDHERPRAFVQQAMAACQCIIIPTPDVTDILRPWAPPGLRFETIPYGQEPHHSRPQGAPKAAHGRRTIVAIARNDPQKMIPWMIDEMRPLLETHRDYHLTIIGRGHEAKAAALAGNPQVSFPGILPHDQALNLLASADLLVCPSSWEMFPLAVTEALGLGIPVVGRNTIGIRHLVQDHVNGLLFDDGSGMRAAMERILGDRDLWQKLSEGALANPRSIPWKESAERHLELYRSLLKGPG
ncbi:MAG: glycosyltransferase family 4 protein [Planctomycetota bacterium]